MPTHVSKPANSPRGARLAALAISTVISVAILEIFLRYVSAYNGQAYSVNPTRSQYRFYKFDPLLGWANAPLMNGVQARDEFSYEISVNEHAMRQGAVALERSPGSQRIAVLGDSFVWGIGVADAQRVTERLADKLSAEVLNFGVSGYGPIQYVQNIDRILEFDPDLVLVFFCLANDWGDNVLFDRYDYFKPYAVLDEAGGLEIRGYPLPNVDDFGFKDPPTGSVILHLLTTAINRSLARPPQAGLVGYRDGMVYQLAALSAADRAIFDRAVHINELLLRELARKMQSKATPWFLVPAPTKCEYSPTCENDNSIRRDAAVRVLEESAARVGVKVIDTFASLDGSAFWEKDGHWNPEGHDRMASTIAAFLRDAGPP